MAAVGSSAHADLEDDIDERDLRAATGAMVTVQEGPGLYTVYSGETETYVVDIIEGRCECPDSTYRGEKCKHVRRVEMALSERPIPEGVRVDPTLRARRGGRR